MRLFICVHLVFVSDRISKLGNRSSPTSSLLFILQIIVTGVRPSVKHQEEKILYIYLQLLVFIIYGV